MERVFSVDDILGTFWKVDSSSDHTSAAAAAAAAAAASGLPHLPGSAFMPPGMPAGLPAGMPAGMPSGMPAGMPAGLSGGELQRPIPRTGSFHRMNRSSSEWAFQEFVREQGMGTVPSNANLVTGMTPLFPGLSQVSSLDKLLLAESPSKLNLSASMKGSGEGDAAAGGFALTEGDPRSSSPHAAASGAFMPTSGSAEHRATGFVSLQKVTGSQCSDKAVA